jgi:hypothetical protein
MAHTAIDTCPESLAAAIIAATVLVTATIIIEAEAPPSRLAAHRVTFAMLLPSCITVPSASAQTRAAGALELRREQEHKFLWHVPARIVDLVATG